MYGSLFKTIEPSHGYWDKARGEDFTYQGLILGIDGHSLVKMAYMFDKISLTIIDSKSRLVEVMKELDLLDTSRKRGAGYLEESVFYGIISLVPP